MSQIKPGILAVIVTAKKEENIGKTVEVISYIGNDKEFECNGIRYSNPEMMHAWYIRCVDGYVITMEDEWMSEGPCPEHCLMPISPNQEVKDTEDVVKRSDVLIC